MVSKENLTTLKKYVVFFSLLHYATALKILISSVTSSCTDVYCKTILLPYNRGEKHIFIDWHLTLPGLVTQTVSPGSGSLAFTLFACVARLTKLGLWTNICMCQCICVISMIGNKEIKSDKWFWTNLFSLQHHKTRFTFGLEYSYDFKSNLLALINVHPKLLFSTFIW